MEVNSLQSRVGEGPRRRPRTGACLLPYLLRSPWGSLPSRSPRAGGGVDHFAAFRSSILVLGSQPALGISNLASCPGPRTLLSPSVPIAKNKPAAAPPPHSQALLLAPGLPAGCGAASVFTLALPICPLLLQLEPGRWFGANLLF